LNSEYWEEFCANCWLTPNETKLFLNCEKYWKKFDKEEKQKFKKISEESKRETLQRVKDQNITEP